MERLKKRWGVKNNVQVVIILVVFAITGSSSVYIKRPIYAWLGVEPDAAWWVKVLLFIVVVLPIYQVLLLFWGSLFGQFRFFWNFEKRMFSRMILPFSSQKIPEEESDQTT
jgi:hypothetical protein